MTKIKHGVILSGGEGTRLQPYTSITNKQLLPLNRKLIIDYPLQTLKEMGVEYLTVVLGGSHFQQIVQYLKNGREHGFKSVNFVFQEKPEGISQALNLCKDTLSGAERFIAILGDNLLQNPINYDETSKKALISLYKTSEIKRFGVATIKDKQIIKIEEKPKEIDDTLENYAITGCYIFDQKFFEYFKESKKSSRGEFEITSIIEAYHKDNNLSYSIIDGWWIDAGTHQSLEKASQLLKG